MGRPFELKFTAIDGRAVDTAALRGRVVLVDFWATWCGPCRAQLPEIKAVYSKFHDKGLEIIGISLDRNKDALTRFLAENDMSWPQYFDGKGFENNIARKYAINGIPALWLVDKKGVLRNTNIGGDLESQVEILLAE